MSDVLLRTEGLCKSFAIGESVIEVLSGIDLEIRRGETVAVTGESGVGKSTLLHILGPLDRPTRGRVWIGGEDAFLKDPISLARLRNATVGFVFQFHHLLPEFSSLENVMMPGRIAGLPPAEVRARARTILEDVGLGHRLDQPVTKLSGGERQRVAVARALVLDPPLVLADEPTGNLDPESGDQIANLLLSMNRSRGTTIVVVTHNERIAARLGRRLEIRRGRAEPRAASSARTSG